jgi:Ca2+/Na+ antiporter
VPAPATAPAATPPVASDVPATTRGWPVQSLTYVVIALGVLLVAVADARARMGLSGGSGLFWAGLALMFLAASVFLLRSDESGRSRLGVLLALAVGLYLAKVLREPNAFTFPDEFSHWRETRDAVDAHAAFQPDPLQPILEHYPGLALVTSAVSQITGLSLFVTGTVLIGVARLLVATVLFFVFTWATGSQRWAGVAVLVYMANPNYLYEGSQFAYESLSLPLAIGVIWLATWGDRPGARTRWVVALGLMVILAAVATHHLSSYWLAVMLVAWAVADFFRRDGENRARRHTTLALGIAAVVGAVSWLIVAAPSTLSYLGPRLGGGSREVADIALGQGSTRKPFTSAHLSAPLWDRGVGIAAVLLILIALPLGLWWLRRARRSTLLTCLALLGCLFPITLIFRLSAQGQETASRASEYVFFGLAPILAYVALRLYDSRPRRMAVPLVAALCVLFLGGVSVGFAYYARLPGPYLVSAGSRSVRPDTVDAARWMRHEIGANQRIAADRMAGKEFGVYGDAHPVSAVADNMNVGRLFLASTFGARQRRVVRRGRISYVVVDRRLLEGLPFDGIYVEDGEPGNRNRRLTRSDLGKFNRTPGISRVFDGGNIRIFDLRGLR